MTIVKLVLTLLVLHVVDAVASRRQNYYEGVIESTGNGFIPPSRRQIDDNDQIPQSILVSPLIDVDDDDFIPVRRGIQLTSIQGDDSDQMPQIIPRRLRAGRRHDDLTPIRPRSQPNGYVIPHRAGRRQIDHMDRKPQIIHIGRQADVDGVWMPPIPVSRRQIDENCIFDNYEK